MVGTSSRENLGNRLAAAVIAIAGLAVGLGVYTFAYAQGGSYLTDNPEACANCHVMREQLDAWVKGSHRFAATCNDCHTPHEPVAKWLTKASNGYHHSLAFTTGHFAEPIAIKSGNAEVAEAACRYCHSAVVHAIDALPGAGAASAIACLHCHSGTGHGR